MPVTCILSMRKKLRQQIHLDETFVKIYVRNSDREILAPVNMLETFEKHGPASPGAVPGITQNGA